MLNFYFYIILLALGSDVKHEVRSITLSGHAQGTTWNITYFSKDSTILQHSIDSIFNSIDSSLSIYKPYSVITRFNNSETGGEIDHHLKSIVMLSRLFTFETEGLSDITVGPLTQAWGFGAKKPDSAPGEQQITQLRECVGLDNIVLRNNFLEKMKPCVKLDVNGIAQGYTVDVIGRYLETKGVQDYLVEVGGELRTKGLKQPGNRPFQVGIEAPSDDEFELTPMQQIISLKNGALTTSGNYRKYFENKGKRYSHIIDPRSGMSVDNEMISATVFAQDATTADALDNALMLMGVENGLQYVEKTEKIAAFFIYKDAEGKIRDTASSRFQKLIDKNNIKK